jgi:hypothetical protein
LRLYYKKGGDDHDRTYAFLGWILVDLSDSHDGVHDVLLFLRHAEVVLVLRDGRGQLEILNRRYAQGEIDREEYEQKRQDIERGQ